MNIYIARQRAPLRIESVSLLCNGSVSIIVVSAGPNLRRGRKTLQLVIKIWQRSEFMSHVSLRLEFLILLAHSGSNHLFKIVNPCFACLLKLLALPPSPI